MGQSSFVAVEGSSASSEAPAPSVPAHSEASPDDPVLRLIAYFDLFDHPVRSAELRILLGNADASGLIERGQVERTGEYLHLPGKSWTVDRREAGARYLRLSEKRISLAARIVASFPFVRGVVLTGSAIKGVLDPLDDLDFLVLVEPRRVWICRTGIELLRRLVSLDLRNAHHRFFRCSQYLSTDSLELDDRNAYTALELALSKPLYNTRLHRRLLEANAWASRYWAGRDPWIGITEVDPFPWPKVLVERALGLFWGGWAEAAIRELHFRRWLGLGIVASRAEFNRRAPPGRIKPGLGARQDFLARQLEGQGERGHHGILRTKARLKALARDPVSTGTRPEVVLTHSARLSSSREDRGAMRPYVPLGPLYVASWLRSKGYRVAAYDPTFDRGLAPFRRFLRRTAPPLVGIHAAEMTRADAISMIAVCRAEEIPVVAGGPDPSNHPALYLREGAAAVVVGEGERPMQELMEHVRDGSRPLSGIPGVFVDSRVFRPSGVPPAVDDLPPPARDLVDMSRYVRAWKRSHGATSMSLLASRGCPFSCSWCSKAVLGRAYRQRSAALVADEMRDIVDRYHPDWLWFADDIFGLTSEWVREFRDAKARRGLTVSFESLSRVDTVDEDKLCLLREAGCRRIWYGAESGSPRMLERMNVGFTVADVRRAAAATRAAGMEAGFFVLVGHPEETTEDIDLTRRMLADLMPDAIAVSVIHPFAHTAFHREVAGRVLPETGRPPGFLRRIGFRSRYGPLFYDVAWRLLAKEWQVRRGRDTGLIDLGRLLFYRGVYRAAAR